MRSSLLLLIALLVALWNAAPWNAAPANGDDGADWPQWAGPTRNFEVHDGERFSSEWPAAGLEALWRQDIGSGYSSIAVVGDRLFTIDREDDTERVRAFNRADGSIAWTFEYAAPHLDGMRTGFGSGPHSTPLIAGGRVFAIGTTGLLHVLSETTGELLWQKDLWGDLAGTFLVRGYASSPIAFGDNIIVTVGGEGQGLIAFDPKSGEERWRNLTFKNSQSSPILIEVEGKQQLVAFVNDEIQAADPTNGKLLWQVEHKAGAAYNIATPIWDAENSRLLVSSAYGGGTRSLRVSGDGVEELWHTGRMKVQYTNIVRLGDHLFGASGSSGAVLLSGLDLRDGKVLWKDRKMGRTSLLPLDGHRAVSMSHDGQLRLLVLTGQGVTVLAEFAVDDDAPTWTVPTVAGDVLYVRNERAIMAFRLPLN